jgi:hypothetical protein
MMLPAKLYAKTADRVACACAAAAYAGGIKESVGQRWPVSQLGVCQAYARDHEKNKIPGAQCARKNL